VGVAPPSTQPQRLTAISREFVADALTPISAYLALAQPGRSCLLESVEGTEALAEVAEIAEIVKIALVLRFRTI